MANVWRIHLRKGVVGNTLPIGEYCLKNKIAAMGWILEKSNEKIKSGEIVIRNFKDYQMYVLQEDYSNYHCVQKLAEEILPGDFIWTYVDGKYYLAKIGKDSKYHYNCSDEAIDNDACNELTNVDWKEIGDHHVVDEIVLAAYQRGQTLRRIYDPKNNTNKFLAVLEYSQKVYAKKTT